jgi:hypothetical protein
MTGKISQLQDCADHKNGMSVLAKRKKQRKRNWILKNRSRTMRPARKIIVDSYLPEGGIVWGEGIQGGRGMMG